MDWIIKPTLAFEQIETIRDDGSVCWQGGEHMWWPAAIRFDTIDELVEFLAKDQTEFLGFQFENVHVSKIVHNEKMYDVTFTFDHARIL
jgi:hypothetical protein